MDGSLELVWLALLGLFTGGYGALIGAGGGFVLVPALLFLYPGEAPETITSISLAAVFFNALSGTLFYARKKRIDYKVGGLFSAASIPGAIAGALATTAVDRASFNVIFGWLLIVIAVVLTVNPGRKGAVTIAQRQGAVRPARLPLPLPLAGIALSSAFGFLSSFLGIGGGILYVPALVYLLGVPVHTATATSLFVLTLTAFTGSVTHLAAGLFEHGVARTVALSVGAVVGAQVGASLSQRIQGEWIIRSLAAALVLVGIRLLFS